MSEDFNNGAGRRHLLAGALLAAVTLSLWCTASGGLAAGSEPGTMMLAQNPPCGRDPQHPCPKGQQPQPKQTPQQQPPQRQAPPPPPAVQHQQTPPSPPAVQQRQQTPPTSRPVQNQTTPPSNQTPGLRRVEPNQGQPRQQQPVQNQPMQNQPVQNPQRGQPVQNQPVQNQQRGQPVQNQPVQNQPVQNQQRGQPVLGGQPPRPPAQPQNAQQGQPPRFGNIQQLRQGRQQRVDPAGRTVIEEADHREIVRPNGGPAFIRHDEAERFLRFGQGHVERRGNEIFNIVVEPNGFQVVTVTDPEGRLIRRFRRGPDGREIVLIDNRLPPGGAVFLNLAPPVITIPQDQYIIDTGVATAPLIYSALEAPPLVPIERPYSLDEIISNVALRDRMRRIDVDTINFDTGSWEITPDQAGRLDLIADAMRRILARNPNEVFLVEGHTDAVGNDVDNLSLSDRRAETVADIMSSTYQIPPENLTTQGYGSQFLKVPTPEANRQNRRVTVRRITPLLTGSNT